MYKISVVIAVYNVEKYIRETIESIINQDIGFESNVQLILVDDGSTDLSGKICKEYVEKFPNNIEYYYKNNGGASSAKNFGVKYAKGDYINFLDSDDMLSLNALRNVYSFFEKEKDKIDMITLPIECFEKKQGLYPRYKRFNSGTCIVDLEKTPQNYVFSSSASFYKKEVFQNLKFNTNLKVAEDLYFNTKLYINNPKFGIMAPEDATYYYRKRYANDSITNANEYEESWLIHVLEYISKGLIVYSLNKREEIPEFLKYILLYNIVKRIDTPNFVSRTSLVKFYKISEQILENIDEDIILEYQYSNYYILAMMLMIKYKDYDIQKLISVDSKNNVVIKGKIIENMENYSIKVSSLKAIDGKLVIQGYFSDIVPKDFEICYKHSGMSIKMKIEETDNIFLQKRFFDKIVSHTYLVSAEIPLKNGLYNFVLKTGSSETVLQIKNIYGDEGILVNKKYVTDKGNYIVKINNKKVFIKEEKSVDEKQK